MNTGQPCPEWEEQLALKYNDLSPAERHALEVHLLTCSNCSATQRSYANLMTQLQSLQDSPIQPLPKLRIVTEEENRQEVVSLPSQSVTTRRERRFTKLFSYLAAATLILSAVLLFHPVVVTFPSFYPVVTTSPTTRVVHNVHDTTPTGEVTEFPISTLGSWPEGIAQGPDSNLWFTDPGSNKIGRITTNGAITEFPISTLGSSPFGITQGPDGNLWFIESGSNSEIGRITTSGAITEFPLPTGSSWLYGITQGPDGNLWFTESGSNSEIGRITSGK